VWDDNEEEVCISIQESFQEMNKRDCLMQIA